LDEVRNRYSKYLVDDPLLDYFETDFHKMIEARMTPGVYISNMRDVHGLTQDELGAKLGGVRASRISDWENDRRAVSKKYAKALAAIFKLPADCFL
jgi:antitoxin component HigA of HigAB toxin-antitoxin module